MILVAGYCPMGCGEQLILGEGHQLWCVHRGCPRPAAAAEILADPEAGHLVTITLDGQFGAWGDFAIRHPLRERLDNALMRCDLHLFLGSEDAPLLKPGCYRAEMDSGRFWGFEKLSTP